MKYGLHSCDKPCGKQIRIRVSKIMQTAAGGCVNGVEEPYKQFFRGAVAQLLAGSVRQRQGSVNHEEAPLLPADGQKARQAEQALPPDLAEALVTDTSLTENYSRSLRRTTP